MVRGKELMVTAANVLTLIALGVCYVQMLQFMLTYLVRNFPHVISSPERMMVSGTSTAIAITVVFIFNRLVTRQNMLGLGLSCGLTAFIYFYIVRSWPHLYTAVLAIFSSYSLFALLAFTVAPVLVGLLWHRKRALSGFRLLLAQGR